MHPNAFLRTYWRLELRPQVFVAMSFATNYGKRYTDVIEPAIKSLTVDGVQLQPFRVDNSKTGESILTEIVDGIAHSRLVLADVSSIGRDSVTGDSYRNGNVMYEVGVALACRRPEDVLLVRADHDRFLFDVSSIPHLTIDFTNIEQARTTLKDALIDRLRTQKFMMDTRLTIAVSGLTNTETEIIRELDEQPDKVLAWTAPPLIRAAHEQAISRLLDKGIIRHHGRLQGKAAYRLTPLGRYVGAIVKQLLRNDPPKDGEQANTPTQSA